jgi:toxin ParE1/3/4
VKPVIRPAARDDILRQFRYYLLDQNLPNLAERFLTAVRKSIDEIARMPAAGAPRRLSREALRGLRSWPIKGFEDVRVYYLLHEGGVHVIRILHGKRDINGILENRPEEL